MSRTKYYKASCKLISAKINPALDTQEVIRNEPMIFACDKEHALRLGGPIIRDFVSKLPSEWLDNPTLIIDSRTHMLMPGWYPAIPGWHLDEIPRTLPNNQPDHFDTPCTSQHISVCVGDASLTEFLVGDFELQEPPPEVIVYKQWTQDVQRIVESGAVDICQPKSGVLVHFWDHSWHRVTPSNKHAWRVFIRATIGAKRKFYNEQRHQVQVYLTGNEDEAGGW